MFRPWGLLDWSLSLSEPRQWAFVGALGTEDRSLAAWRWMRDLRLLQSSLLLEIPDQPSRHSQRYNEKIAARRQEHQIHGGDAGEIRRVDLLAPIHVIDTIAEEIENRNGPVLLDITSLPKRFFFIFLRAFIRSSRVADLVVTYTSPREYATAEPLSENWDAWAHLPGFPGHSSPAEHLVVCMGFMAESLQQHFTDMVRHEAIDILIPFPSPLAAVRRSWEAVYHLEVERDTAKFSEHRVDAVDMSSAFDRIVSLKRPNSAPLAFAPFGPKPISAAMCLYACQKNSPVYYPQPRVYNPDYSIGIGDAGGKRAVNAFWAKHASNNLYGLPDQGVAAAAGAQTAVQPTQQEPQPLE